MYEFWEPSAGLERWVDAFWAFESTGAPHRVVPDGCLDFLFDLDAGTGVVIGAMTRAEVVRLPAGARAFGVRFLPGAAALFLDAHAWELTDRDAPLDDVTKGASGLAARVAEAASGARRSTIVEAFLMDAGSRRRASDARVDRAVAAIRRTRGTATVNDVAADSGVGERQLERLFNERVGIRPKHLCRVARLEHATLLLSGNMSQADGAAHADYADEPHLLREFRALTGVTPRELLAERRVGFVQSGAPRSR